MKKLRIVVFIILFPFLSCKKDQRGIPDIFVDIYIYTTDPSFVNLSATGGWAYITGGSRGILVYRRSSNEFVAFDRHCTYEPENPCGVVEVDVTNNIIAVDLCCGSEFLLTDGSVNTGPASIPLKQYQTNFDGTVLHIFN